MKKVLKFVKGKKDCGGVTPSQSGELISPAQTPEEEGTSGMENGYGYNVDFSGKDKTLTKLHKAAWHGNLEKLKSALKKVDVDAVDRHSRTALHFAVAQGHPNIVWFLLGNNANTSICDDKGHSPLLKAIECEHKECMTLLLDRGANVNVADYGGNTGLHIAIGRASFDTASSLLKNAADPDVSNNAGDYPLHIATRLESKDLVDLLLSAGAFVDVLDRENRTPLMLAAKTGNRVLAQLFVERGAQLTVVDSNGWTAQDYAMLGGHEDVACWLSSQVHGEPRAKPQPSDSLSDDTQTHPGENDPATENLDGISDKCSLQEVAREKHEDSTESPDAEAIPPYCEPPRSWEIIQAGMIDENKDGSEPKRRSITTLGTLHSRRESFGEPSAACPMSTLSLNRRRPSKEHNAFAKNRFSLNEEESLSLWLNRESNPAEDSVGAVGGERHSTSGSDEDSSGSGENWKVRRPGSAGIDPLESHLIDTWMGDPRSGTLGRLSTMLGVEELWVANPHLTPERQSRGENPFSSWDSQGESPQPERTFPPPPTGLELGIDMARSMRCLKGLSVDQSPGLSMERILWRNDCGRHTMDCPDGRDIVEGLKPRAIGFHSEKPLKYLKSTDRLTDVSRKINEQLECYDQALRELAESSRKRERPGTQKYLSLPWKGGSLDEWRRMSCQGSSAEGEQGAESRSLPTGGSQRREEVAGEKNGEGNAEEKVDKKRKKHMLLAMREVKHSVQVTNSFATSMDDQILSPLGKPEDSFDSDEKSTAKDISSESGGNSPADENPFFGVGRQETVLERNDGGRESEDSETAEEPTLWLQDEAQRKENSDDDVAEIAADEDPKHGTASSFSPLGVIHREMEEESRGQRRPKPPGERLCGENEEQNEEVVGEQSPDVSLSSGPIEPLGAEDSGSEPESSHNDVSPPHNYALKSQHEWLKSHLRAATSEKNKLEELTAQLTEKAERLQYELADAKEAGKSRDEVIQLLQGQLARMEAAYTRSLEESVQSRLQLTSHEQEILHLKELCYRYQEEKEAAASGPGGEFLQDLQLKIKILEEEKEKMREEINHLEEEKSLLEGQLRQRPEGQGDAEVADQCQRWKERCKELEEMVKACASKKAECESCAKEKDVGLVEQEQSLRLRKKLAEAREENMELKAEVESLGLAVEREKRRALGTEKEKEELMAELKRRNMETENELRRVAKEMEEQWVRKLKEKEEEMSAVVARSRSEKEQGLGAGSPEEKVTEELDGVKGTGKIDETQWRGKKAERLGGERRRVKRERELGRSRRFGVTEMRRRGGRLSLGEEGVNEGIREHWEEGVRNGDSGGRWKGGILGEIMGRCEQETEGANRAVHDLEYLELKKQILSLESKMSNEKNLRHSLENEIIKMRVSLNEKENLEMEVDSLKRKVGMQWLGKSGVELLEYERDLQAKREKYLTRSDGAVQQSSDDYKAKCQLLAREREKFKQLTKSFHPTPKTFFCPPSSPSPSPNLHPYPFSHSQFLLHPPQLLLHPHLKNNLDYQLDKSMHRYIQGLPSTHSISNMRI